jgi:hypothetical protein
MKAIQEDLIRASYGTHRHAREAHFKEDTPTGGEIADQQRMLDELMANIKTEVTPQNRPFFTEDPRSLTQRWQSRLIRNGVDEGLIKFEKLDGGNSGRDIDYAKEATDELTMLHYKLELLAYAMSNRRRFLEKGNIVTLHRKAEEGQPQPAPEPGYKVDSVLANGALRLKLPGKNGSTIDAPHVDIFYDDIAKMLPEEEAPSLKDEDDGYVTVREG